MPGHPKLRPDLKVSTYRESDGTETFILKEPVSEKFFRLSRYEFELLKALDGTVSLAEAVERLKWRGSYYPLDEAQTIVSRAAQHGLVMGTGAGTAKYLGEMKERVQQAMKTRRFSSFYFMNLPLWNPDNFLSRTVWLFQLLCNRWTAILLAIAAPGAIYCVIDGLPRLETEYLFFFTWQNLMCLWAVIVVTKLVHEFSHAYTAKSFGLHVPQMGVALLLFLPCLFCNTTDAWQLADRRQRMAISAAGILAETVLAVVFTYVWYFTEPGIANSVAFYLMTISLVSTFIFNANPLIKFDGYYVLMDYLRIPNLATKSMEHLRYLFMDRVMGVPVPASPARSARETVIFSVYGVSSFLYRISLYFGIVAGIYYRFDKFLGILLAIPALVLFVIRPLIRGATILYTRRAEIRPRPKGAILFTLLVVGVLSGFFISWPRQSVYRCYVASVAAQKITVPLRTSVKEVFVRPGSRVKAGDLLFTLDTTQLDLALATRQIDRAIVAKQVELLLLDDEKRAMADSKRIELLKIEDDIVRTREKLALAKEGIRAPFDAIVTAVDYRLQQGFGPGEGAIVGEMESVAGRVAQALIPEEDLGKVRTGQVVKIWLPSDGGHLYSLPVESVKPYSERNLSDSPFSSRLGGDVATEIKGEQELDSPLRAYYTCSVRFAREEELPLGVTGRLIVPAAPRSMFAHLADHLVQVFNRESLL